MRRAWLVLSRSWLVLSTLLPMWLAYAVPFVRSRRFGAVIPDARWDALHARHAARFRSLAIRMRGGLIKVGQILSTRVDILPPVWIEALASLQDQVTPHSWGEIEPHLRRSYGGTAPETLFASLDKHATAAASFGQGPSCAHRPRRGRRTENSLPRHRAQARHRHARVGPCPSALQPLPPASPHAPDLRGDAPRARG